MSASGKSGLADMRHKNHPGCPCCSCSATITADAKCGGTGSALTSVTFDLRDAADTTTLQTQTGSSASFTVTGTVGYKVRVTKTGYHTKISSTITPACGATASTTVSTWPTTATLNVHAILSAPSCAHENAAVVLTGDVSGSGTTDSSGNVAFTITTSSSLVTQSITITITSPSGTGSAVYATTVTFNACTGLTHNATILPDSSHVAIVCGQRYLPDTLSYSDTYGSCTLGWTGSAWNGTYSYTSNHAIVDVLCSGVTRAVQDQTGDVYVLINVSPSGVCNGNATFTMRRTVSKAAAGTCAAPLSVKCQVVIGEPLGDGLGYTVNGSFDCSTTSISWVGSSPGYSDFIYGCSLGYVEETPLASIVITGTI